jgi:membrane protein YqaA with SNARE-associated domain
MTLTERSREAPDVTDVTGSTDAPNDVSDVGPLLRRFALLLVVMLLGTGVAAHFLRPSAEATARDFVERFGVAGMALGTLLADGLYFPVPPQFYMLLAIASHTPLSHGFTAIALASVLAGIVGYAISERLSRLRWISRRTRSLRRALAGSFERRGYAAAFLLTLLPIPFSMLCYLAGLNRMPLKFLALLALLRIPKLAVFYVLLHLGWSIA